MCACACARAHVGAFASAWLVGIPDDEGDGSVGQREELDVPEPVLLPHVDRAA